MNNIAWNIVQIAEVLQIDPLKVLDKLEDFMCLQDFEDVSFDVTEEIERESHNRRNEGSNQKQ